MTTPVIGRWMLLLTLLAPRFVGAQPPQTEATEATAETPDSETEAAAAEGDLPATDEIPVEAPPPPKPPDGLLPVMEIARLEYAPTDRPKPLLHGQVLLVVSASGFVEAHDAETGAFAWKLGLPGEELFDPVVFEPANAEEGPAAPFAILLSEPSGHVLVIDGRTGNIQQETRLPFELALPPVRGPEQILFLATPSGDILAYDLERREVVFQTATGEPPLALASTETLLIVSGGSQKLTAIDLPSGNLRWSFVGRAAFHAPAAFGIDGERIYVGDNTGEFFALEASSGKVKFRWSTGAAIRSQALVEEERVYVATFANAVYAYHATNGDEHWRSNLPGRPATRPFRVNQRLMVATLDGMLVELNPARGTIGQRYAAPGEIVHAPSLYLATPSPEELEAELQAELAAGDGDEDEDDALARDVNDPLAPPESNFFDRLGMAPDEPEIVFDEEAAGALADGESPEDALLDDAEALPPREPMWFERSRIALALRTGEVLLLQHQVPGATPPSATEEPPAPDEDPAPTETPVYPRNNALHPCKTEASCVPFLTGRLSPSVEAEWVPASFRAGTKCATAESGAGREASRMQWRFDTSVA